jgi:putative flavoprotein involved in K+ transport
VFLAVSRHRRVPRRFRGRDVYWWLERMGRFEQSNDALPGRRPPPHTAVTGVGGGHDIDLRALAAAGAHVLGSLLDVRGSRIVLAGNANQILDEADAAYLSFVAAARAFAAAIEEPLTEDDALVPTGTPVPEITQLDLEREHVTSVVWATGYDYAYDWLHADVLGPKHRPVQRRGMTAVPGLFFLGLHWMHTFKSGLLSGVGADTHYIAEKLDEPDRAP